MPEKPRKNPYGFDLPNPCRCGACVVCHCFYGPRVVPKVVPEPSPPPEPTASQVTADCQRSLFDDVSEDR
jgi:hypothetical protein